MTDDAIVAQLRRASPQLLAWWRSTLDAPVDADPPALADALMDVAIIIDQLLARDRRGELPSLLAVVEQVYASGTPAQRALVRRHVLEALAESCSLSGLSPKHLEERLGPQCRAVWLEVAAR